MTSASDGTDGAASPAAAPGQSLEARAAFLLGLRARGVRDLAVLRAMEAVPRGAFVPDRYAAMANRDMALPLPCGQTMSDPLTVGRILQALAVTPACRILEIGAGSGYATAILARLGRDVLGVDRFRTLALHARTRLNAVGIDNATVVWGDGLRVPADAGPFDRILVHAELPELPACLAALLGPGGAIAFARRGRPGESRAQYLVKLTRRPDRDWTETQVAPSRLRPLLDGPSQGL